MQGPIGTSEPEVESRSVRSQEIREHGRRCLALRVPVLGRLDDLRIETQRRVVDEDATVDGGQVHMVFNSICEGVEGTDDVIAVQTEVECKVISGPGRNYHVRKAVTGGDRGDEGLGTIASRHPENIGTPGHCVLCKLEQVVPRMEDDGLDSSLLALVDKVKTLSFPTAGLQVHDQHGMCSAGGQLAVSRLATVPSDRPCPERTVPRPLTRAPRRRWKRCEPTLRSAHTKPPTTRPNARMTNPAATNRMTSSPRQYVPGADDHHDHPDQDRDRRPKVDDASDEEDDHCSSERRQGDESRETLGDASACDQSSGSGLFHPTRRVSRQQPVADPENATTADSIVGKKCVGSIVRVNRYRSILARTGCLSSANTSEIPLRLSASSRSSSMSAAVVSTSVIGSAATTIQRGCGSASGERPNLFSEGSGVGENERGVESEDGEALNLLCVGMGTEIVIPGDPIDSSEARAVGPPGTAEDIENREPHCDADSREHAQERHSHERGDRRGRTRFGAPPRAAAAPECRPARYAAAMTTAASVGWGRFLNSAGKADQHEQNHCGTDESGHLCLCAGLCRNCSPRSAGTHGEPLKEASGDVRSADANHLLIGLNLVPTPSSEGRRGRDGVGQRDKRNPECAGNEQSHVRK